MDKDRTLAQEYAQRAAEVRKLAEGMTDEEARELLLKVADDYDKLTESARILDQSNPPHTDT